ncbi:MAG TPA: gluconate 2-dehydrogenase subunit 3 family protein [Mucilaginibacter sp.]|jgi:hypothetical protein
MERRVALRNIAFIVGSAISIPSWADGLSKTTTYQPGTSLSAEDNPLLASVADAIIPDTDTPGAKELGVPALIQKILADCYEKEVNDSFYKGMNWANDKAKTDNGKPFADCTTAQRLAILKQVQSEDPASDQAKFIKMAKELTILGYTSSEYVVTKINKYVMIPGHYYGNVPLNYVDPNARN